MKVRYIHNGTQYTVKSHDFKVEYGSLVFISETGAMSGPVLLKEVEIIFIKLDESSHRVDASDDAETMILFSKTYLEIVTFLSDHIDLTKFKMVSLETYNLENEPDPYFWLRFDLEDGDPKEHYYLIQENSYIDSVEDSKLVKEVNEAEPDPEEREDNYSVTKISEIEFMGMKLVLFRENYYTA